MLMFLYCSEYYNIILYCIKCSYYTYKAYVPNKVAVIFINNRYCNFQNNYKVLKTRTILLYVLVI